MKTPPNHPLFTQRMQELAAALAEWEKAHPELAAAWDEALGEEEARRLEREKKKAEAQARAHLEAACRTVGLPIRALRALEARMPTEAIGALEALGDGVTLLSGGPGIGKTVAAALRVREALQAALARNPERVREDPARVALFYRAVTLARASAFGQEAAVLLERLRTTRLLVIDDLGAEYASPVWDMLLFELLDTRHGDCLPTVLTTNLGKEKLRERYGQRLAERVREGGAAVFLNGESMRGEP